jgi:hypothetical protein
MGSMDSIALRPSMGKSFRRGGEGTTAVRVSRTAFVNAPLSSAGPAQPATIVTVDLPTGVRSVLGFDPPNSTFDVLRGLDQRVCATTKSAIRRITTPAKR